ncbi:methyl-accepting chemotaxis protein [Kineosporia sp. J2-2]|uniref:Methyl-accepting chemotaxis protein n=1 Tax=Kineosporia corallincola TaxID=2835133 RepID=A0ABS5TBP8_9ACTN|nr:methyl-accepting chemotaxis protein [Kineosporia corallincola]MBT0767548.1 methyl-accepting chemotaxis protein [Kineosporia corallincola]
MTAASDTMSTSTGRFSPVRFLTDLRIGVKILTLAGLAVVLTALVGITGQLAVNNVQSTSEKIANVTAEESQSILKARANYSGFRRYIYTVALAQDADSRDSGIASAKENYDDALNTMKELQQMELPAAVQTTLADKLIPATEQSWQIWQDDLLPTASKLDLTATQLAAYMAQVTADFDPVANSVRDEIATVTDALDAAMAAQVKQAASDAKSASIRIWLFTLVGAVLLVGGGLGISRLVSGPVRRLQESLHALAEGDLTRSTDVHSRDEIGDMASALNDATVSLRQAMVQISGTSGTLSDSARNLSSISAQISSSADATSNQANNLAGTATEVSGNVQTVAAGTEEMSASIREIANSSSEAVRVASSAVNEAVTARATVAKLGDSSIEIGNVVKAITSIAEQTNLLALNATIEAARAGEAGKGFAVVAEEVKQLAQETARATEDISKRVEAIQADTQEAVDAIARISQTIEDVNSYQTTIASAVEEQTATTSEISRSIAEAAGGSASIASSVDSVANAAQASSDSISQAEQAAGELSGLSAELRQLVSRFRL